MIIMFCAGGGVQPSSLWELCYDYIDIFNSKVSIIELFRIRTFALVFYQSSYLEKTLRTVSLQQQTLFLFQNFPTLHVLIQVLHVSGAQRHTVQHTPTEAGTTAAGLLHL